MLTETSLKRTLQRGIRHRGSQREGRATFTKDILEGHPMRVFNNGNLEHDFLYRRPRPQRRCFRAKSRSRWPA